VIVPPQQRLDLTDALALEVSGYEALLELLRAEQNALKVADPDALAQVAQAKLKQVYNLQDVGAARAQAMRDAAPAVKTADPAVRLAESGQPQAARELWQTLVALASEAQRQNALNRRLASVQQRHVDRAMAALWGAAGRADTYGADGRTQHNAPLRQVAAI
jgi:flagellar biosynthesis/type III secretory pathway chaperone